MNKNASNKRGNFVEISENHIVFTSARDINEICTPLKKYLDILVSGYVKSFDDDSVINLHTNPEIIKNFLALIHLLYIL